MIKVGDKVRVVTDFYYNFTNCDVVTCIKVDDDGIHMFQGADGVEWWLEPVDYEPIKDGEHD